MESKTIDLRRIVDQFAIGGTYVQGGPYGNGHINDTYCVVMSDDRRYILQRVNGHVFKRPDLLMENVARVTAHVRGRLIGLGRDADRHGLTLLPTAAGDSWHVDEEGAVWRLYIFIEDTVAYDIVDSTDVARQSGSAFGEFQHFLSDLPGEPLHETIPDFHNMEMRYGMFRDALSADRVGRAALVATEIGFVEDREETMTVLQRLGREGKLPMRITHNDTKINNVLFDAATLKAACVIDLDTIMPGYVLFDFGDSIRTAANTAAEDEKHVEKVKVDLDLYSAYTEGYLSSATCFLTPIEISLLAESARIMTFIIGLRFLTDFLDGDRYFKVHRENHNLDRARAQFALVDSMEDKASLMSDIVQECYGKAQ